MWRGLVIRRWALRRLARPLLRLAPLEIFAQRKLQPILPRLFPSGIYFARPIHHFSSLSRPQKSYPEACGAVEARRRSSDQAVVHAGKTGTECGLHRLAGARPAVERAGFHFDSGAFSCLRLKGACGKNRPPVTAF
jgi:hypothetical protein